MATKKRRYDDGGKVTASSPPPVEKKKKSNLMFGGLGGLLPMIAQKFGPETFSPMAMIEKNGPEVLSPLAMAMKRKRRRGEPIRPSGAASPTPSPTPAAAGGMKRGGKVKPKAYAKGGKVSSRGDGIARKGKTKGRYI